jgi:hypothetical protein
MVNRVQYTGMQPDTPGGTMRKHRLAALFALCTAVMLLQAGPAAAGEASCRADEYELMSLLIREQYGSEFSLILIGRDTETWCLREHLGVLQRKWARLKSETIDSLIVTNSGAQHRLAGKFDLPVEYRLISEDEYMRALRLDADHSSGTLTAGADAAATGMDAYTAIQGAVEPDWDNFDRVFPDALGYLTFSRIAFDSECTQALVIFCNAYRCSGILAKPGTRHVAFFDRRDGGWKLVGVSRGISVMD